MPQTFEELSSKNMTLKASYATNPLLLLLCAAAGVLLDRKSVV